MILIPELASFSLVGGFWETTAELDMFHQKWPITIGVSAQPGGGPPTDQQGDTLGAFWRTHESTLYATLPMIRTFYEDVAPGYRDSLGPELAAQLAPILRDVDDLVRVIRPDDLWVPQGRGHSGVVVLLCSCTWDPEQGIGVRFVNSQPDFVGEQGLVL